MSETSIDQDERIRQAADKLFTEAKYVGELTRKNVLALAGVPFNRTTFSRVFPGNTFTLLIQTWLQQRIENAMAEVFAAAKKRSDVTIQKIADIAECGRETVSKFVGPQFHARRQTLPDTTQLVLQTIERMIEDKIPIKDYTWEHVYTEVGVRYSRSRNKLTQVFQDGLETLTRYYEEQRDPGVTYALIQGKRLNVDEPVWYLASLERNIRRSRLRADIAAIAWPLIREEAIETLPSESTLLYLYQGYLSIGKLLGTTIPDIRSLTLATFQNVWLSSDATKATRQNMRSGLVRILEAMINQSASDSSSNAQEYILALNWLKMLRFKEPKSTKAYLSEVEFEELIDCSLKDIMHGMEYLQHLDSPADHVTLGHQAQSAEPMLHWGIGLIILVMAFTGLRRQSIVRLTIEDIAQIGPEVYALTWRHGKPKKQRIAVIPRLVAEYLQHYINATELVRTHLGKQEIFLTRNNHRLWTQMTVIRLDYACKVFVARHTLKRDSTSLRLGSNILRRTYTTRALYELPNIPALQAQLGHNNAITTLAYAQHDRFEHPDQVDSALDVFGRKVLTRWYKPLLLNDLSDAERKVLLVSRNAHEQDVGMCRHQTCVKLNEDHLPPCSLCEHLVSGAEYLAAWEHEKVLREQKMEQIAKSPGSELLLAQLKGQYDRFMANYRFVQERSYT